MSRTFNNWVLVLKSSTRAVVPETEPVNNVSLDRVTFGADINIGNVEESDIAASLVSECPCAFRLIVPTLPIDVENANILAPVPEETFC